jgi:hypothetical protein
MKMKTFEDLVAEEVLAARIKHKPINSVHEGYAVMLEEMDEFWDWVKRKSKDRDPNEMLIELVQIGAMAQRCAMDVVIPLLEKK